MQYRSQLALTDVISPADPLYQGTQLSAWIPRFGCRLVVSFVLGRWGVCPHVVRVDNALDGTITSFTETTCTPMQGITRGWRHG